MTEKELTKLVLTYLEEESPFDEPEGLLVENDGVKPIVSYIGKTICSACNEMLLALPVYLIGEPNVVDLTADLNANLATNVRVEDKVGIMPMPTDFLRVHSVKLGSWARVANSAISSQNPLYAIQRNPYTRGKSERPVVAMRDGELELYSWVRRNDKFDVFKYVQRVEARREAGEDADFVCDKVAGYCAINCAIKLYEIFEKQNQATLLHEELQKQLQIITL